MIRIIAPLGVIAAALVCSGPSLAAETAESLLNDKGLRRSGEMYVLRAEDDVKKASDAVELRFKEFLAAATREKYAVRSEAEKKVMAAELTKQYGALRQQYNQSMPAYRAQMQNLSQQQAAIRQQLEGLRYAAGAASTGAWNQLVAQSNGLSDQMDQLSSQRNQLVETLNETSAQVEELTSRSSPAGPTLQTAPSAEDRGDAHTRAVEALRKLVDEIKAKYEALAADEEVKGALETLNQKSPKIKYVLGPSRKFLDSVKALELAEAKGKLDPSEVAAPKAVPKRKLKTAKRKARSGLDAPAVVKDAPGAENNP